MGVDYSAVAGYGFVIADCDIPDVAERFNYMEFAFDDGETHYIDEIEYYDFLEWLAASTGLNYVTAGDAYSGSLFYLFGLVSSINIFGLEEIDPRLIECDRSKVDEVAAKWGFEPHFYAGLYIW